MSPGSWRRHKEQGSALADSRTVGIDLDVDTPSEETETIITDPSPVAHLRVIKARLEPKPGHVVPDRAEMRRLVGLADGDGSDVERQIAEQEDAEGEDNDEALLHADVLDAESRAMLRVVREGISKTSVSTPISELDERLQHLDVDPDDTISPDVTELNRRGRWFGAVVELVRQGEDEDVGALMRRQFVALRGKPFVVASYLDTPPAYILVVLMTLHRHSATSLARLYLDPTYQPVPGTNVRLSHRQRRIHSILWVGTS